MGDRSSSGGVGGAGGSGGQIAYLSLTVTNYISWSIRVQAIMEDQGVWEVVEPLVGTSENGQTTAMAAKDKKVRAHLLHRLPNDLLMQVAK